MPIIDFREIPEANRATGEQDQFELFARDFLVEVMKFDILSNPNRGPDEGKDILAVENVVGTLSSSKIKWLVSCKHKAYSKTSVNDDDERNISDRMEQHNADGFLGFYSTLASSGLNKRIDSLRANTRKIYIFDKEDIERRIICGRHIELMQRYFPRSAKQWVEERERTIPSKILGEYLPLYCAFCGEDLLNADGKFDGMLVYAKKMITNEISYAYAVCRGSCETAMKFRMLKDMNCNTEGQKISDIIIPCVYLDEIFSIMNSIYFGRKKYTLDGYEKTSELLLAISQMVIRKENEQQVRRASVLFNTREKF